MILVGATFTGKLSKICRDTAKNMSGVTVDDFITKYLQD